MQVKFFHDRNFVHFGSFCGIYSLFILCLKLLKIYAWFKKWAAYDLGCSFTETCSLTGF